MCLAKVKRLHLPSASEHRGSFNDGRTMSMPWCCKSLANEMFFYILIDPLEKMKIVLKGTGSSAVPIISCPSVCFLAACEDYSDTLT